MLAQSAGTTHRIQSAAKEALEKHYITYVIVAIRWLFIENVVHKFK